MMRPTILEGLALACIFCAFLLAQYHDEQGQISEERIATTRAQMAARGVCGTGSELALLREGYACLHTRPDGTMLARPVFDSPVQLAVGRH
jgi:hypothetical protein